MKSLVKKGISDEFVKLCMTKPIDKITITDITQAAGICKQTFYNYFKDKSDLMIYAFQEDSEEVTDALNDNIDDYIELNRKFLERLKGNKKYYRKIVQYTTQNGFSDYFNYVTMNFYKNYLTKKYGTDVFTKELNTALKFYCAGCSSIIQEWILSDMSEDAGEVAANLFSCIPEPMKKLLFRDTVHGK